MNFNATYRIREGEHAAVLNYPIFVGVAPAGNGPGDSLLHRQREERQRREFPTLGIRHLQNRTAAGRHRPPGFSAASSLAVGMTKAIAVRHRDVAVKTFISALISVGLQRSSTRHRVVPRVQMPAAFLRSWRWADWSYNANSGQILNAKGELLPLNYFMIGVSRSHAG